MGNEPEEHKWICGLRCLPFYLEVCPLPGGLDGLHDARLPHEGDGGPPVVILEDRGVAVHAGERVARGDEELLVLA